MPENSVELFEPDSVAARCEDVPLMELHLGEESSPGRNDADVSAIADARNHWRIWQRIGPAIRFGVHHEFFRLLDDAGAYSGTPYVSSYDAIYGEEPIEVRRTATGTYVVVEGHRGVLTARWLGIDPIPVVVLPENEG
jgi:hypothetical protein